MGKKQTTRQAESTPELTSGQVIARVVGPRGKNMHEVQYADGQTTLAVLPPRFRNLIWVKRGHYVVLDPEATSSDKMGGEIVHVLFPEHVKDLRAQGKWPEEFNANANPTPSSRSNDMNSDSEENSDDDLFVNNNRPVMEETDSDSDDDDSEESDDNQKETQA